MLFLFYLSVLYGVSFRCLKNIVRVFFLCLVCVVVLYGTSSLSIYARGFMSVAFQKKKTIDQISSL